MQFVKQLPLKRGRLVIALCCLQLSLTQVARSEESKSSASVVSIQQLLATDQQLQWTAGQAKSNDQKKQLNAQLSTFKSELPGKLIQLAEKYPNTTGGLAALYWAAFLQATPASQSAVGIFQKWVVSADLDQLAAATTLGRQGSQEFGGNLEIARALLNRVKQEPSHQKAAELVTCVCRIAEPKSGHRQATEVFTEAAELIASQYASSPEITNFCELLGRGLGSPPWASPFEEHLRKILQANEHRHIRCAAAYALASVVQDSPTDRQVEAVELYQQFLKDFDGKHQYHFQSIEQGYRRCAAQELDELAFRAIGKPAIETSGVNLDGTPMKLSDYRGKVVLLSFWATWCAPCIKLIPHEKALSERYAGMPFAIVGVNGDPNEKAAMNAVAAHGITWRSFRDDRTGEPSISKAWKVRGWPTIYLIDGDGIIRKRWRNDPSPKEMDDAIANLLKAAGPSSDRQQK
jgi:thiol-disulfide isomerase/thioredoxin